MYMLAPSQEQQLAEAVGFKQEPKEMSFWGLLTVSELRKFNGQYIGKKQQK